MKRIEAWAFVVAVVTTANTVAVAQELTYSQSIGPLIERKCVHCHRTGGMAPMPFMSYSEFRQWASRSYTPLDALLRTRAMPPWPADPEIGEFANSEFMTDEDIETLVQWVKAGMPRGNGPYAGPAERGEWTAGDPDHVIALPEYTVPENVIAKYRTVRIETNFPEDRWIVASEIRPGNAYAVRGIAAGVLGAFQPGHTVTRYPEPYGMLLEKGAAVEVTFHYFKEEGVEETDRTRIELYFAKDTALRRPIVQEPMRAEPFVVPAGKADFEVEVRFTFPENAAILAVMPVMHNRGKRVAYALTVPNGAEKTLLSIPEWNPNWKYRYRFREAVPAPKGSVLAATAVFDNSEANLKNPDPWSDAPMGPDGETFEAWLEYAPTGTDTRPDR